jgi:tetratricopeptide (TPR) repeat protein
MCPAHRKEADAVIRSRIARAEASNPAGWRMLGYASARLSLPHLPGGLATRLAAAETNLVLRARLLAEAAAGFPGRPDDFGSALAENRDQAGRFPSWPVTLIRDLGRAGEGTEAVTLSEALAGVDPARRALFAGEAAIALAEAGLPEDARAEIAKNVERWPDDVRARILAGDALAILGDAEAALAHFQAALPLAQQAKDYMSIRDLSTRIFRLTRPSSGQVTRLAVILSAACPAELVVLAGVGVNISKFQHRVPDVAVVHADSFETFFQETPPELVVEVVSPRTRLYDRNRKKDVYQGFGIPAYWIVEPDRERPKLTIFELRSGAYGETAHVTGDEEYHAASVPGDHRAVQARHGLLTSATKPPRTLSTLPGRPPRTGDRMYPA